MRQKVRRTLIYLSLLFFPVTLNFFSPYVSIDGAFQGIIAGSVIVFFLLFLSGIFLGRSWCAWGCPVAGLSELSLSINNKTVPVRVLKMIRYSIFSVWFGILTAVFILSGGIRAINPLHLTESFISVDEPLKYITYYLVLLSFFALTIWLGKRGACHSICWMSPLIVAGSKLGKFLHIPRLKITSAPENCIACKKCDTKCPMSIPVSQALKDGSIQSSDCILCGECVDVCPKDVLHYHVR